MYNKINGLLCVLIGSLILQNGCGGVPENLQPESEKFPIYFYKEKESPERLFDMTNGNLKANVQLKNAADHIFQLGNNMNAIKTSLPLSLDRFIIDGNYAVQLGRKYKIKHLDVADSFVELMGQAKIQALWIGFNIFRFSIHPKKVSPSINTASVLLKGNGPFVVGEIAADSSFLTIEKAMLVTNDPERLPTSSGLVVEASRKDDLWRMWSPSVSITKSTLKAPSITLKSRSTLSLRKAILETATFESESKSIVLLVDASKTTGIIRSRKGSVWMFHEGNDQKNLFISSFSGNKSAVIDATISIYSSWSPSNETESFHSYQDLIRKKNRFVLVEGEKLLGRASLLSQADTQALLGSNLREVSYFEKFVSKADKKLALEHDYNQGKLFLVIVDKNQALDKDNCLPDIGVFDRKTYLELLK
jgi:hypothetical protein